MSADSFAIFIHQDGFWVRRSALRDNPAPLARFMREDEMLRFLPDGEKDILRGPANVLREQCIPNELLTELVRKNMVEAITRL